MLSKCPNCGSSMEFNPDKKKLECPNCRSEADVFPQGQRSGNSCPQCGAPLEKAENKVTYKCPYCQTWAVLDDKTEGDYEAKKIMPFTFGKKTAIEHMKKAFDNVPFMPSDFISSEREKDLKGVYVPFFLYCVSAQGVYHYTGEKLSSWTVGATTYTKHDVYNLDRPYDGVLSAPIDASDEIKDDIIDALSPFDDKDSVDFDFKYLPGFEMHVFDKPATDEEYTDRAIKWADESVKEALKDSVEGYSGIGISSQEGDLHIQDAAYTYRPVYVYDYKYGSKPYQVYLNGTNDRVSGVAPIDKKKLLGHYVFEIVCALVALVSLGEILLLL